MSEVRERISTVLKDVFGFNQFKAKQQEIIEAVLNQDDVFVIMPTGGGKSLCYQLPAIASEGTAVIISPLIALMKNQVDAVRNLGSDEGLAHFLNSSLNKTEITLVKRDVTEGKTKLLYLAPESLTKPENIDFFKSIKISFVAVDEAHCISEWGHDFRPEYRKIKEMVRAINQKIPLMALTATATPKVQVDIQKNLGMSNAIVFKDTFNRPNLHYEIRPKTNVLKEIVQYIKSNTGKSGIIYCLSRKKVEELAQTLQVNGIKALPYHAGLDGNHRAASQDKFLMEDVDVMVATIAFGMGIDKPDVRYVIHYDMPKSLEGYYQETGRAGRDGGEGNCIAFYNYRDIEKLEKFLTGKPLSEQEIGKQMLNEVVSYSESAVCRRKFLLQYFGEEFHTVDCGKCDNCLNPKEKAEASAELKLILETILFLKEKFKSKYVIHVLIGKNSAKIKTYKHDSIPLFGAGQEQDEKFWISLMRQAIVHGFVVKDIETYGTVYLSDKGKEFIKNPTTFKIAIDHEYPEVEEADIETIAPKNSSGALDQNLFDLLKSLNKKIAKEKNLPPYVIFQEPSLQDMSIQYPLTVEELKNVAGVGQGKALKYGKPFLETIKKYVEENEIERPFEMAVKSMVNKSVQKVFIIQSIDRKMDLEDIANAKGWNIKELIHQIEIIVDSGTRVNIDYYIDEILDREQQSDIYNYFRTSEKDCVKTALEQLEENEFTEEDVRLMRIKFISELGN